MAFPNVEGILRLFLSLMVTNCSREKYYLRPKRIKLNYGHNISGDVESDKLRQRNFDELLDDWTMKKSR